MNEFRKWYLKLWKGELRGNGIGNIGKWNFWEMVLETLENGIENFGK